jgi:hypothetical protein
MEYWKRIAKCKMKNAKCKVQNEKSNDGRMGMMEKK